MDTIYPPSNYNVSDVINLNQFYEDFLKINKTVTCLPVQETKKRKGDNTLIGIQNILQNFDVSLKYDEIKKLSKKCSTDELTSNEESPELPEKLARIYKPTTKLTFAHTMSLNARKLEVVQAFEANKGNFNLMEALVNEKRRLPQQAHVKDESAFVDISPGSDFQLKAHVYQPIHINGRLRFPKVLKFHFEIVVRGQMKLTELRDEILCASDSGISREVENMKKQEQLKDPKDEYPSGFFFIENTFYNDFRHPKAIDYSTVIRQWAIEKDIGELKTDDMDAVRIKDLKLRLGYPYLYMHQGDCEHLIVFFDAKIIQRYDILCSKGYPYLADFNVYSVKFRCYICSGNACQWLVKNGNRLAYDKTYLCTRCCKSYNFIDGKKVGEFELYPFYPVNYKNNIIDPISEHL